MKPEEINEKAIYDKEKEEWRCKKCNSVIMSVTRTVSMHMKGSMAGFGETYRKEIPYCPKCEDVPSCSGFDYYGSETDPDVIDNKIIRSITKKEGL